MLIIPKVRQNGWAAIKESDLSLLRLVGKWALLLVSLPAWAGGVICEPPYSNGTEAGPEPVLCEIQATAKRFLDQHNVRNKTDWKPLGPDLRVWVPPCQLPMRAAWTGSETRRSVMVSCARKWKVDVDVTGESVQLNYDIHKAASEFVRLDYPKRNPSRTAGYPPEATMVAKCTSPLAVKWRDGSKSSVDVICSKTVHTTWAKANWRVNVPVG
jgi:hypothetical protein